MNESRIIASVADTTQQQSWDREREREREGGREREGEGEREGRVGYASGSEMVGIAFRTPDTHAHSVVCHVLVFFMTYVVCCSSSSRYPMASVAPTTHLRFYPSIDPPTPPSILPFSSIHPPSIYPSMLACLLLAVNDNNY